MDTATKILSEAILKRTYSRSLDSSQKEDWNDICDRVEPYIQNYGKLTPEETLLVRDYSRSLITTFSGRMAWVGGTDWSCQPQNYPGLYNCNGTRINSWGDFEKNFDLLMQGCGVGSVSTQEQIEKLPLIRNRINLNFIGDFGAIAKENRQEHTSLHRDEEDGSIYLVIGDSRQGWSSALRLILETASQEFEIPSVTLTIDLSNIRPQGEKIKGFGGTANPSGLQRLFEQTVKTTNKAVNRQLSPTEAELILCEAGVATVSGNVRRSARLALGSPKDTDFRDAKKNLWQPDSEGNWKIDPDRDAYRMANFSRAFDNLSYDQVLESIREQYQTSEGAIQNKREAIARGNADLLNTPNKKQGFLQAYRQDPCKAREFLANLLKGKSHPNFSEEEELDHRMQRFGMNPCVTGDTMVLTSEGNFPIKDLVGKKVSVWDGQQWVTIDNFRVTGENQPVYNVLLSNGEKITATPYHKFILEDGTRKELQDLDPNDRLMSHDPDNSLKVFDVVYSHVADQVYCCTVPTHAFSLSNGAVIGNCGEIIGSDFFCNLSLVHLSQLDPEDWMGQVEAFQAGAIQVASLLTQQFNYKKYKESREFDPIVAVNFTGGWNFFLNRFGSIWLDFWKADRDRNFDTVDLFPSNRKLREEKALRDLYYSLIEDGRPDATLGEMIVSVENYYYEFWREIVNEKVSDFCQKRGLRTPNRVTALQPAGTKSLLTGDTPGWHPPFSAAYVRRVNFQRNHPVALAALDIGLNVIPAVDSTDENGYLLDDIWDERVQNWLVEFPILTKDAELMEEEEFDPSQISALAQFDFAMEVQKNFVEHNSSSTIQFREDEIEPLAKRIYQAIDNDEGYISFALQARFENTGAMPRLPFEPRSVEEIKEKQKGLDYDLFKEKVQQHFMEQNFQDAEGAKFFCTSDKCEMS